MATTNLTRNPRKVREMLDTFIHKQDSAVSSQSDDSCTSEIKTSCNPTDRTKFMERVKTFSTITWVAKPLELSPMHCARYGWINDENDQLKCVTCSVSLYAGLPDEWDSGTYKEICGKLQLELKTGHSKLCPWQENCCPISYLSLPYQSKEQWTSFLRDSFSGLLMLGKEMPLLNEDVLDEMGLAERGVIQELLSIVNHQKTTDEQNLFARTAVALAICGWKAGDDMKEDTTIFCDTCGKECGLWNYVRITEDVTPLRAKRFLHGNEAGNLDARLIYASFISDRSTFRSSEFVSSNASMHSEADSQMSENGMVGSLLNPNEAKAFQTGVINEKSAGLQGSEIPDDAAKQEVSFELLSEGSGEPIDENKMLKKNEGTPQLSKRESRADSYIFTEPLAPYVGKMELMKALLLATAPGEHDSSVRYSESVISEVGSEAFEKRIDIAKEELSAETLLGRDPEPPPPPPANQENLMKELLFVTAPRDGSPMGSASVFSEVGSLMFDKRLEVASVCSPRAETPTFKDRLEMLDNEGSSHSNTLEGRVKRMRFHDISQQTFSVVEEHHCWCPWVTEPEGSSSDGTQKEKALSGWRNVLFSLLNAGSRNDRLLQGSPDEMWKSVRKFLQECQSPNSKRS